jgi:hypothetical protein
MVIYTGRNGLTVALRIKLKDVLYIPWIRQWCSILLRQADASGSANLCHPERTLFFDGSSRKQGAEVGVLLLTSDGEKFKYMVHLDFKTTNNMAEYEPPIFGLSTTLSLGVWQLLVKGDSQLIIKQVKGECSCNDP